MFCELEALLKRENQRFSCVPAGGPNSAVSYTAQIEHQVSPPLDAHALTALHQCVGDLPQLLAFYARFGSLRLYCDRLSNASAFYIAPPTEWADLHDGFSGWIEALDVGERDEFLPDWIANVAVIGEVPQSGNYFLLPLVGLDRGKVIEFEHDGFEFIERGADLAAFIAHISTVTDDLLQDILTHTRYSDGHTSTQWMPESYHFDA